LQVILTQDVDKLGYRGDVVEVARGYARNYLLPRGLAHEASPGRLADLERRDSLRARHEAKSFDEARELADRLAAAELRFDVKAGPTGALFGSVTPTTIADELWERLKIRVDRRKIGLDEPIKRIGRYQVPIDLFTDVRVEVRTLVVPEGGELPPEEELEAMAAAEAEAAAAAAAPAEPEGQVEYLDDEPEDAAAEGEPEPEAPEASAEESEPEAAPGEAPADESAPA
jgi:large subunit ribosomal protein L9